MKKIISLVLCLMLVLAFAGCGQSQPATSQPAASQPAASQPAASQPAASQDTQEVYNVAFVAKSLSNELFIAYDVGMKAFVDDYNAKAGYTKVVYNSHTTANESDVAQMVDLCETLLTQDLDALLITPASSTSFANIVKTCNDKGILFIDLDTEVDASELAAVGAKFDLFLGNDNVEMGEAIFQSVVDEFNGTCKYITIGGFEGASTHIEMMAGMKIVEDKNPGMVRIDYQPADWNRNKAYEIASSLLTAHPDVECFVALNDQMASGVISAIENIGKVPGKDIKVAGSTFVGDGPANVFEGKQISSVSRQPNLCGKTAIEQAIRWCEGLDFEHPNLKGDRLLVPVKPVKPADLTKGPSGNYLDKDGVDVSTW